MESTLVRFLRWGSLHTKMWLLIRCIILLLLLITITDIENTYVPEEIIVIANRITFEHVCKDLSYQTNIKHQII